MKSLILKTISGVVAVLMLLLAAGCGGKTADTAQTAAATQQAEQKQDSQAQETKAQEKTNVRYILLNDLKTNQFDKNNIAADFYSKHPGVEITFEAVEFADLDKKILMAHAANDDYDIIQTNHSSVPQFVAGGVLEPLSSYIQKAGIDLSTYQQAAVKIGQVGGQQYAIPYDPDCRVFAYNKKILSEAGVEPPKTMDDMLKVAKAVSEKGYYAMAGMYSKNWFPVYDIGSWMLGNGGHLYVQDGTKYKATLDTPEVIDFVKWAQEMYKYMPKDANMDDNAVRALFAQGKVAMYWWGPWEYAMTLDKMNADDVGFSIMPTGKLKSGSSMGGWMFGIGSGSKKKDAAWTFVEYVNQPENMAKISSALPADSRAFQYPPFNDPKYQIFNEQFKTAEYPAPPTPVYPQTAEVFNKYFSQAMMGKITPEEACKKSNEEVQKYLDTVK